MSGLDSQLVAELRATADEAAVAVDIVRAGARLQARLDLVEHGRRRRRRWVTAVAVGAAAAAVGVLVAGRAAHQSAPLPPTQPTPSPSLTSSLLTLADHPFLTPDDISYWNVVRQDRPAPPRLSACLSDPRTWGAAEDGAQTYIDPHQADVVINEFVLRFDDTVNAHLAVLDALHQLVTCRSQTDVAVDPAELRQPLAGASINPPIDEYFAQQRSQFPTAQRINGTDIFYAVRIARASNVVVVVEDTGLTSDRPLLPLTEAVGRAVEGSLLARSDAWCAQFLIDCPSATNAPSHSGP